LTIITIAETRDGVFQREINVPKVTTYRGYRKRRSVFSDASVALASCLAVFVRCFVSDKKPNGFDEPVFQV